MDRTHPEDRFSPTLYEPWCRAWLYLQVHRQRLAEWLGLQSHGKEGSVHEVGPDILEETLGTLLARLRQGPPADQELVTLLACLQALERLHPKDSRHFTGQGPASGPPEVALDDRRYVLIPPPRQTTRPHNPHARFPVRDDLAIDGTLQLWGYRWLLLQGEDRLKWLKIAALDKVRQTGLLRVGLAPFASRDEMVWSVNPDTPRKPDGRVPVQCGGAIDPDRLGAVLDSVLAAAWEERVHLLLLPELVVHDGLLQRCSDWLRKNNARQRRICLVVAGSRHQEEGAGFVNRCTVLNEMGDRLWYQDKRSPFVIDDRATLDRLCPNARVEKLFEPTLLGRGLVLAESAAGRLASPVCIDFIEGDLWPELGADLYLVPAMTPGLSRFEHRAREMGGRHGAATFVCNAQISGPHRSVEYVPFRGAPKAVPVADLPLFTFDLPVNV